MQKMSKSLGNAIGINEPASEMYGKLMSISDELMWKYWVFLTDLKSSEIAEMAELVTNGGLHPMQVEEEPGADNYGGVPLGGRGGGCGGELGEAVSAARRGGGCASGAGFAFG